MLNRTPFYPKRKLSIADTYNRLERELFSPWAFFHSGKPIIVTNCEGRKVQYSGGLEFSGSPREVFWRFFDPDIRKVIIEQIEQTMEDCEVISDLLETALDETRELLHEFVERVYERLADIDQALRGKGFPKSVTPRPVTGMIKAMVNMMDDHIDAVIRHAGLKRWGNVLLQPEQKQLLMNIAEAAGSLPEGKREEFFVGSDLNLGGHYVAHPGLTKKRPVFLGDIEALKKEGLINATTGESFDITPRGLAYFRHLKREAGKPIERVEAELRQYLGSAYFRTSYPEAYSKWIEAEKLLWEADSQKHLTTIGHLCREAMQEFAETLVNRHKPPEVNQDKSKTVARVRTVLNLYAPSLGDTERAFLDALIAYWGAVADLSQRQEHGSQKEGSPLTWEDGRRVVFQTLLVMYEIDRALSRVQSRVTS